MNPPLRCVLFDLDGVLADYDRQARVEHLARSLDRTPQAVHAAIYESGIEAAADAGRLDARAYLDALGARLNRPVSADRWVAARRVATRVRPDVLALAASLRGKLALGLLTNNGWLMAERLPEIAPELFPLFAGRACAAAQFGAAKPDAAAYLGCLEALGAQAATTLFVDDALENVQGALAAGLQAHHYRDLPGLLGRLAEAGLP